MALVAAGAFLLGAPSCQKDDLLKPGSSQNNILTAHYVPPEVFKGHEIEIDGEALEVEWGGQFDADRPFTMIRLTSNDGAGLLDVPVYLAAKAVYTDDYIFLLMQWADASPDVMKDATYWVGEDLTPREDPERPGELMYPAKAAVADSTVLRDENWRRGTDLFGTPKEEDRLYLAFEIEPAGDSKGSFHQRGCQIACHSAEVPHFGRPESGRLDVWEWLATRTNPARTLLDPSDNPEFPKYGTPGFLDDFSAQSVSGLVPDPGSPVWYRNWTGDHTAPSYVYRAADDPFVNPSDPDITNAFGEKGLPNNRLPYYYIWREKIEVNVRTLSPTDTLNEAVLPQGQSPRNWTPEDAISGYFYSYPTESRADVKGRAIHSNGLWTLEIGRLLDTGDGANDATFRWVTGPDSSLYIPDVYFTAAMGNNSELNHRGSGPQVLHFAPKPSPTAARKEGAR